MSVLEYYIELLRATSEIRGIPPFFKLPNSRLFVVPYFYLLADRAELLMTRNSGNWTLKHH